MPSTRLKPEHIGEPLVATLLTLACKRDSAERVVCRSPNDGAELSLGELFRRESFGSEVEFRDNVPIHPIKHKDKEYRLDGQSQIDCLAVSGSRGIAIAMEVKLGVNRMAKGTFEQQFLSPCRLDKHRPRRIKGKMTALLDRRRVKGLSRDLIPVDADLDRSRVPVSLTWLLVIRHKVWAKWGEGADCPAFNGTNYVILLEELVSLVGGPKRFDDIVSKLIGSGFAEAWGLA